MEKKEKPFDGRVVNGFAMLFVVLVLIPAAGVCAGLLLPTAWGITLASLIGVGYLYLESDTYPCTRCGRRVDAVRKHYFGPTQAAVSAIYLF